jgi:hypothetical protein
MPGGLLQLVAVGAQNELVNGSPSMTHFRAVYRRHTNFAMESIRMGFTASNLEFSATGTKTLSCRIDRYAQLLHDTYLVLTLPDIWSPLKYLGTSALPTGYGAGPLTQTIPNAIGYEFQWIDNVGYNMIDRVELSMNGQVIQTLSGEWLKLYSYMTHDRNKRQIVDQMVGNVPELNDPANAYDRKNQYPHAITPIAIPDAFPKTTIPEPSIRSRQLVVPLHFWFSENPGVALPLAALQNSEVYINVVLRSITDLYTVIDVNPANTATYGQRVKPTQYPLQLFLSPPTASGTASNPLLTTFFPDPYLEGNFIYLTETEWNQIAKADTTVLIKTVRYVGKEGQFGGNTDLEIPMYNLVTRIVFASRRSDRILANDWDNYTNWPDPSRAPWTPAGTTNPQSMYSSGQQQISSIFPRDALIDGVLLFDAKERFQTKPLPYFSLLQMYRHTTGDTPGLPGIYMYSFALDHDQYQPSGAANGSLLNKVILRLTLQQPLPQSSVTTGASTTTIVCVLKSTLFNQTPTIIPPGDVGLYNPGDLVTVVQGNDNVIFVYTYTVGVYVEAINFLRIVSGLGNLVFAN